MTRRSTFASWKTPLAAGLMAACCTGFSAHAQAPSSFQRSCRDITVSGAVLSAVCRRMDGSWNRTAIQIDGIENIDGHLRVTGGGPSSYQRSCRNMAANGDVLFANCRRMDGSWRPTDIHIPGIANIDGVLRYER
jgi:hypothetical protein